MRQGKAELLALQQFELLKMFDLVLIDHQLSLCIILFQVVLCFSPVGSTLRVRSRKFPAVTNCTSIDWFHEWPEDALNSVSARFLEEVELLAVSANIMDFYQTILKTIFQLLTILIITEKLIIVTFF